MKICIINQFIIDIDLKNNFKVKNIRKKIKNINY